MVNSIWWSVIIIIIKWKDGWFQTIFLSRLAAGFEEEHKVMLERMQDEAEDAEQLAMELGKCIHVIVKIFSWF